MNAELSGNMPRKSVSPAEGARDSRTRKSATPLALSADTPTAIGTDALALAKRARAIGMNAVAHLLESAALQAGSEAAAAQWPTDA
jgi:hypothetical protein